LKHLTVHSNQYQSKKTLLSSYNFVGERNTGHSIEGEKPIIYYPFSQVKKSFFSKVSVNINKMIKNENTTYIHHILCLSKVLKKIKFNKNNEKQIIICMNADSKRMIKDALEVNKTAWTDDLRLLSTTDVHVLLTDYTSVRGCEFYNVVLVYTNDEGHLKQNLIDCISRSVLNIRLIVLNIGVPDKTLFIILNEWKRKDLVDIDDENYLKNVTQQELKEFIEINAHLVINDDDSKQILDIEDVKVIQKKYNTEHLTTGNKNQTTGNVKEIASFHILLHMWDVCERAESTNDVILMFDTLNENNLTIDSLYYYVLDRYYTHGNLLHYGIHTPSLNICNFLISMNININSTDNFGCSPLHVAAEKNNIDVVKLLLQQNNIDINITDNIGRSPLYIAAANNSIDVVKLLLQQNNIDINITTNKGLSPLHVAAANNSIDVVKLLLRQDIIDINLLLLTIVGHHCMLQLRITVSMLLSYCYNKILSISILLLTKVCHHCMLQLGIIVSMSLSYCYNKIKSISILLLTMVCRHCMLQDYFRSGIIMTL